MEPETEGWWLNLNAAHFGQAPEYPRAGTVEDWVFVNMTMDTHPMHTHLFTHQVIGRVPFATGPMLPPTPDERGFKDTTKVNPGTFTIVRDRIELPAGVQAPQSYVYHCHIVEHEDNDMMQSFTVLPRYRRRARPGSGRRRS